MASESTSVSIDTSKARQNIKQLNSEVKALESGFKAATAGMKDWTSSITGNEERAKALTDIIQAQSDTIEQLNALYEEAVAKYGENSVQANNLRTQINNTTASMREHESELEEVNGRLEELTGSESDAGDEAEDLAGSLDDAGVSAGETAGDAGELAGALDETGDEAEDAAEGIGSFAREVGSVVLEGITGAVQALASALRDAASAGYEWATSVGQQADNWNTMASVTGVSAEKLQEWSYASQFVDTDLSVITGSMRRLTTAMGDAKDGSETAKDKFDSLGVSITNADGSMRSAEDVFWDIIAALGAIEDPTERDAAAMELMGRSAQELNPLIEAGKDKFIEYGEEAHALGVVLSDDQLAIANSFNDAQNAFQSTLQATKNLIGVDMIPAFQPLLEIETEVLSKFNAILGDGIQEGDGQQMVEALKGAWAGVKEWWESPEVQELLTAIVGIGKEMVTGIVDWLASDDARNDITGAIDGFFDWLNEDMGEGKTRLAGIAETIATTLVELIGAVLKSIGPVIATLWNDLLDGIVGDSDNAIANWIRENLMLNPDFLTEQPGAEGLNAADELAALRERGDVYDVQYTSEGGGRWTYKEFDPNAAPEWEQADLSSRLAEIEKAGGDIAGTLDPLQEFISGVAEAGGTIEDSGQNLAFFEDMIATMSEEGLDAAEQLQMLNDAFNELINDEGESEVMGKWAQYADLWNSEFMAAAAGAGESGVEGLNSAAGDFAASGAGLAQAWLAGANSVRPSRSAYNDRLHRSYGITRY